ncbi:o-succinylbenzoate--CoA ligase [Cellulomonas edaphi]|uniref:O-succinylbenzoate--CoA ligase n=1 Tax=Cellulomonas edaphi TaxID=3053468 RepID=A0ABT7S9C5_9CELL|nr:o-succinylbenzoate--CoA ligase [Cellulomons edaphi]MDM7832231.1 o-succinylbenzoate--CoA ligase [Cellulomons edaphi]
MTRPLRDVSARPDLLLGALAAALDGSGPAVLPREDVRPDRPESDEVPADVALVVHTSGSTGEPRGVMLGAAALRASASATAARLSGPGQWLLALPATHVAGVQVLVRSVLAGTTPVVLEPGPFRPAAFVAGAARMAPGTRYTSLVPTQLVRLLEDPAATAALTGFDAVLLGGAATPGALLAAARAAGVRVVTTYGMSETCGGCVYDGVPLDGVCLALEDGRVTIAGPVLATGYLGRPDLDAETFVVRDGVRRLRTADLGRIDRGVLTVLGRADDVIVTGGVNVAPAAVEDVVAALPGVAEVCVVGLPDDEWGQAVVAAVVPAGTPPTLEAVRAAVSAALGSPSAPRRLVVLDQLPHRGPGKHDRRTLALALTDRRTTT